MAVSKKLEVEDRLKIAEHIVKLSDQVLSTRENPKYIALKIGNWNAVTVRKNSDRVSFFITSTDLINRTKAAGFDPALVPAKKDKYRFWGLRLADLQTHEDLFREIVKESRRTITDSSPRNKTK
jgi:hypothetical protein